MGSGGFQHSGRQTGRCRTSAAGGLWDWSFDAVPWNFPAALESQPLVFQHSNRSLARLHLWFHQSTRAGNQYQPTGSFSRVAVSPSPSNSQEDHCLLDRLCASSYPSNSSPERFPFLLPLDTSQPQEEPESHDGLVPGGSSPKRGALASRMPSTQLFPHPAKAPSMLTASPLAAAAVSASASGQSFQDFGHLLLHSLITWSHQETPPRKLGDLPRCFPKPGALGTRIPWQGVRRGQEDFGSDKSTCPCLLTCHTE